MKRPRTLLFRKQGTPLRLFALMTIFLCCLALILPASAEDVETTIVAEGVCGENLTWTLYDDGKLSILGSGPMAYYSSRFDVPWDSYRANITSISFGDGITSVGQYSFSGCEQIQSVCIPDGVTSIGFGAFAACSNLQTVTLPNSVTYIGAAAFESCARLESIEIPGNVSTIGDSAFHLCSSLQSVDIPASVSHIGRYAFSGCTTLQCICVADENAAYTSDDCGVLFDKAMTTLIQYPAGSPTSTYSIPKGVVVIGETSFFGCTSLQAVDISNGVTTIGERAFAESEGLQTVSLPESITAIGSGAFYWCTSIESVDIPPGVTSIEMFTFEGCTNLQKVTIPEGVVSVGVQAFHRCTSLQDITIPSSVTNIDEWAFADCNSLQRIYVDENNLHYTSDAQGVLFNKEMTSLIMYPPSNNSESYTIPSSVIYVRDKAFEHCSNLQEIVIPQGVASIGSYAFKDCSAVYEITIPDSVSEIGYAAFWSCSWMKKVTISGSVSEIEAGLFRYCPLTGVSIPEKVSSIGHTAFHGCTSLRYVNIPVNVTSIEGSAFSWCPNLSAIYIPNSVTELGDGVVESNTTICGYNDSVAHKYATENSIPFFSMDDKAPQSIEIYNLPRSMTCTSDDPNLTGLLVLADYGEYKFAVSDYNVDCSIEGTVCTVEISYLGCSAQFEMTFEDPVIATGICGGESDGTNLTWTLDSDGVLAIAGTGTMADFSERSSPWYAEYKDKIQEVVLAEGVTSIGAWAFEGCTSLESISIPESVTKISDGAFYSCSALDAVKLPENLEFIGYRAFRLCTKLTSVTIPAKVIKISEEAFGYCTGLTEIVVAAENPNFASKDGVLFNVDKSKLICYPAGREGDSYEIPEGVTRVGAFAFSHSTLTEVTIAASVTTLDGWTFYGCENLVTVNMPESISHWGSAVFFGCTSLSEIVIPNGVESVPECCFVGCAKLRSVTIPESVARIEYYAFSSCSKLSSVYFEGSAPEIKDLAFEFVSATMYYPCTSETWVEEQMLDYGGTLSWEETHQIEILTEGKEASCTEPGLLDQLWCTACETVFEQEVIPAYGHNFVENICDICGVVGGSCGENLEWTIEGGVLTISGTGDMTEYELFISDAPWYGTYSNEIIKVVVEDGVTSIGGRAFIKCSNLTEVQLPESLLVIEYFAFQDCISLESIVIPEGVTRLVWGAFMRCTGLKEIILPESLQCIETYVFEDCTSLVSIAIPSEVYSISDAFPGCTSLMEINVDVQNESYMSVEGVLYNKSLTALICYPAGKTGEHYEIIDGVTTISCYAFSSSLPVTVSIPDSVTEIGHNAFEFCCNLIEIKIPNGVEIIQQRSFYGCSNLNLVLLPESITAIEFNSFFQCYNLSAVVFEGAAPVIDELAFWYAIATAYYPCDNESWTEDVMLQYGGTVAWKPNHQLEILEKGYKPTCTESGLSDLARCTSCDETLGQEVLPARHSFIGSHCGLCGIRGGACGLDVQWTLVDHVLTICGSGDMAEFAVIGAPWYKDYRNEIYEVIVEEGVTSIGDNAFCECEQLKRVTLSNTVTQIRYFAFGKCFSLDGVLIPASVEFLDEGAFFMCFGLRTLAFAGNAPTIDDFAFATCPATVYYPSPNGTWTADKLLDYSGNLTWVPYAAGTKYHVRFSIDAIPQTQFTLNITISNLFGRADDIALVAIYSTEGRMLEVITYNLTNGVTAENISLTRDNSNGKIGIVRVFILDGFSSPIPLAAAEGIQTRE